MIFITVAMLSEGKNLIRRLGMRRISQETRFQIFTNGRMFLVITGVGGTKAMMATLYLLMRFQAKKTDFLLSAGIGAWVSPSDRFNERRGQIYLARKIENYAFHRTFYPDLLYTTPFPEADVLTLPSVYHKGEEFPAMPPSDGATPVLADMEAAFVFEAAGMFLYAHHLFFLKIISDDGDLNDVTRQTVLVLMDSQTDRITGFLNRLEAEDIRAESNTEVSMKPDDQILLDRLKQTLRLTCYQQNEMQKLAESYICRKGSISPLLEKIPENDAKTKKEGKERYEQFRKLLMEP